MQPPPYPPPPPPISARRPVQWLIPLVIGLLVGGGLGVGVMALANRGGGDTSDAGLACAILEDTPAVSKDLELHEVLRLGAAYSLADAAARQDARYEPLADVTKELYLSLQMFDIEKGNDKLREAADLCRAS